MKVPAAFEVTFTDIEFGTAIKRVDGTHAVHFVIESAITHEVKPKPHLGHNAEYFGRPDDWVPVEEK